MKVFHIFRLKNFYFLKINAFFLNLFFFFSLVFFFLVSLLVTYSHHLLPHVHSSLAYRLAHHLFVCASPTSRVSTYTPFVCHFFTFAFVAYLPAHCLFITSSLACHISMCMSLLRLCVACSSFACHIVYALPMPYLFAYVSPTHIPTKHLAPCSSPLT
jgi:hypothetical protein